MPMNKALEAAIRVKAVLENGNDFPNTEDCMLVARFAIRATEALEKIAAGRWIGKDGKGYAIAEPSSVEAKIARAVLKGD